MEILIKGLSNIICQISGLEDKALESLPEFRAKIHGGGKYREK